MQLGKQSRRNFGSKVGAYKIYPKKSAETQWNSRELTLVSTSHFQLTFVMDTQVLNKASRQREPLVARVAIFQLCPVTAKFLQLRCGSLLEV